jgi:hypothetical protein
MSEALWPKYLSLFAWVLGIYGTSLLPTNIRQSALLGAVVAFVVWIVWDGQRRPRALKRQLEATKVRERAPRRTSGEALVQ